MPTTVSVTLREQRSSPSRFAKAINDPNLILVVLCSVLGLVIATVMMFCFPNLGAIIAQYNQFDLKLKAN